MTFLPIVERELRAVARRPATYWTRLAFAAVGVGVVSLALLFAVVAETARSRAGGNLFKFLSLVALGFSGLAGVFLTADCLSEEKREGTLGLLFLTDLNGYDIVFGKLFVRSLSAGYGLLAFLPILAITLTMGGVTAGEFWRMVLVLLNTLFFSLAAGMFVSSMSLHYNRSMAGAAGLILTIGAALPLAEFILHRAGLAVRWMLSLPSPVTTWELAFDASYRISRQGFGISLLLTQTLSWLFLALASVLLPRLWPGTASVNPGAGGKAARAVESILLRRLARRTPLRDLNPIYWLVLRQSRSVWSVWVIWAGLTGAYAWAACRDPTMAVSAGQHGWGLLLAMLRILVGVHACRFFVDARRSGALEELLSTPLTIDEILRGQWMALRRTFLAPTIALLFAGWVPWLLVFFTDLRAAFPAGIVMGSMYVYAIVKLICDLLAAAWTGMLVGLTVKRLALAPGLTVLYTVVLPVAAFCVPDVVISLPLFLWAREKLYRQLRVLSSPRYLPITPLYGQGAKATARPPPVIFG